MKIHIKYKLFVLGVVSILWISNPICTLAQEKKIGAVVINDEGSPIQNVIVQTSKGVGALTNENGEFSITVTKEKSLSLKKDGFQSQIVEISDLDGQIVMKKSLFLKSERDLIKQGITTKYKRDIVGSVSSITPKEHITYDYTQYVKHYIDGLLTGTQGGTKIRGLGNAVFVIDGIIGRDPNLLNMDEVDQITVLKDASAIALYGTQAKNGVIVINTKRGEANTRKAKVNVSFGMRDPISTPKYLGSVEYMELYNEARANDGLEPTYDQLLIEEYKNSTNQYKYPDIDLYSDEYIRSKIFTTNVLTEFSGGNTKTQYYVNLGWNYNQSWINMNPSANKGRSRFNLRGNIDFEVNDFIKSSVDVVAIIGSDKKGHTNFFETATTFKPNAYAPFLPVSMIYTDLNPELAAQVEAANKYDGMLLGASPISKENSPIGKALVGGYVNDVNRSTQFNNAIDFDLSMITEGLSAKTFLSFDFYDSYTLSMNNQIKTYEPTWSGDSIIALTAYGNADQKDTKENVNEGSFDINMGFYGLLNYKKRFKTNHSIDATLLAFYNSVNRNQAIQTQKNSHIGAQFTYSFKDKFYADFSGSYVYSIKLPENNRGGFAPTLGLAYVLSEEDFIRKASFIDYLKLRASGGVLKTDMGLAYYMYDETYSGDGSFSWADGTRSNGRKRISQGANPNLTYSERFDLNFGFEANMWKSLWIEFNYFNTDFRKLSTKRNTSYPSFYSSFIPNENYNENNFSGFELGLNYTRSFNDITLSVGGNILYSTSEITLRDEVYEYDYQKRVGTPTNAIIGFVDDGFYTENDFVSDENGELQLIEGLPIPSFGAVQPGDVKYLNLNEDDVIDANDQKEIGVNTHPWSYGVNYTIKYKGFSLFALGVGEFGGESILSDKYYRNNGNVKYSEMARLRWTPETANTAEYPRLSANTNQNNYKASTFWLYDDSYFSLKRVQLTYEFPKNICSKIGMGNMSINVAAANVFELSKNTDIRQLKIGNSPMSRAYTIGLRTTF